MNQWPVVVWPVVVAIDDRSDHCLLRRDFSPVIRSLELDQRRQTWPQFSDARQNQGVTQHDMHDKPVVVGTQRRHARRRR